MIIQFIFTLVLLEYVNNKLKTKYGMNDIIVPSYLLGIICEKLISASLKLGYYSANTYYTIKKYVLNVFLINFTDLIFNFVQDILTSIINIIKPLLIIIISPLYLIKGWFDRTSQSYIKTEVLIFFNKINDLIFNNYINEIKIRSFILVENIKFCAYYVINFLNKIIVHYPSSKIIISIYFCLLYFFNVSIVYYPIFLTIFIAFYWIKIKNINCSEQ